MQGLHSSRVTQQLTTLNLRRMETIDCEAMLSVHVFGREECVDRTALGHDREFQLGHCRLGRGLVDKATGFRAREACSEGFEGVGLDFED